ncbi:MAG: ABC transporter permease [Saprospiraceae bacterium]|nr:ABC transporter permease [Saprospiraceae bacterium]
MRIFLRVFSESAMQAWSQLSGNKLRSFLSLLGITIGIFCIIAIQAAVNSMQDNVMGSLDKLGDDVVYVSKMSWTEDPHTNYWKYQRRPNIDYHDFEAVKTKAETVGAASLHVFIGMKTLKYRSNSVEGAFCVAVTYDMDEIFRPEYEKGRYYTPAEYQQGANKVLIGSKVAEELFGSIEPIGRKIRMSGRDMEVIGVFKRSGKDLLKVMDFDNGVIISYELGKKLANLKVDNPFGASLNVKAADGIDIEKMKDDLTGTLRQERHLKPKEEDNFSLNTMSIIAKLLGNVFGVLNLVGLVIGMFAIVVGMVSVANIMFVSVKERTNIIGIKKALGARNGVILLEFLIESVILCIVGGILGLVFVYILLAVLEKSLPFPVYLDLGNISWGMLISIIVGILAGVIPAMQASRMDPVDAMRQGA